MRGNTIMDTKIILQAVYYLSTKLGTIDKLHAIKYFYFADKYHLMKYSRMITNDTYYAMKMGPVASNVKNILSNDDFDNPEEEQLFSLYIGFGDSKSGF